MRICHAYVYVTPVKNSCEFFTPVKYSNDFVKNSHAFFTLVKNSHICEFARILHKCDERFIKTRMFVMRTYLSEVCRFLWKGCKYLTLSRGRSPSSKATSCIGNMRRNPHHVNNPKQFRPPRPPPHPNPSEPQFYIVKLGFSGEKELVCVLLVHLFVCFVRVTFCHFSLPLGVGGWLQFVIVALPGLFY